MKIVICGPHCDEAISKVKDSFNFDVKTPWEVNGKSSIIDYAAETFKSTKSQNIIFKGSPFDFLGKSEGEGYDDVNEQIALSTLVNVDYIVVITRDMDKALIKSYNEYAKLFPNKFYIYESENEFEIVLK